MNNNDYYVIFYDRENIFQASDFVHVYTLTRGRTVYSFLDIGSK